jgi:hypothetical protein
MKKLLLGFLIILSANVFAQQKGISYQAVIINPNSISAPGYNAVGTPLANKSVCMSFQILNAASQTEYQETQTISTDQYGMVNLVIGTGTKTGGTAASLAAVTWSLGGKSLVVAVNTEGTCSSYTEISRQALNYVPYAMYADDANIKDGFITTAKLADGSVTDAKVAAGINKTKVGLGNVDNTSDANKQISTATQTALNLKEDAANKSVDVTLADVTNTKFPTEKAVKAYVDGKVAAATIADADASTKGKIQLAGDLGGTAAAPTVPALANKENSVNKSTITTLGSSDVLFPTQNAVKTYVDTKVAAATIADADASTKGKIQLAGDLGGTAAAPTVPGLANKANISSLATVATSGNYNDLTNKPAAYALPTASVSALGGVKVGSNLSIDANGVLSGVANVVDADQATKGKIQLAGDLTGTAVAPTIAAAAITTSKIADGAVSDVKIVDLSANKITGNLTVAQGGTGSNSLTGYVFGNGTSSLTSKTSIPVADVTGAIKKVNGISPVNGEVNISFGYVTTGTLANIPVSVGNNGDIYVVSGDASASNNGRTYISDGSSWKEVTTNQAATDARYVQLAGSTMLGDLSFPSGKKATMVDAPINTTDLTNKKYVDDQISFGAPDASTLTKGKIMLAGDLGGTASLPTIALGAVTDSKISDVNANKITGVLDVAHGGTGSNSLIGYLKGNGTSALSTSSTIPIADVNGAVRTVNGNSPAANGNVTISFGSVITGTLSARPTNPGTNGNIYVVSSDPTTANNGRTYISDGTAWQEVTANQSATDSRYVQLSGSTMQGDIIFPTGKKASMVDAPSSTYDLVNKSYVDAQVSSGAPNATTTSTGKIQLAGDLAGAGSIATAPVISNNAITTLKVIDEAITTAKIKDGTIVNADLNKSTIPLSGFATPTIDVDMGGKKITSLLNPALAQDAATKNYVDANLANYLPITGGTLTGPFASTTISARLFYSAPQVLTPGTNITWPVYSGLNASVTLNANSTLAFSTTPPLGVYGTLIVAQPATGGPFTLTLPSSLTNKVLGSSTGTVTLSTTANSKDILTFYYDGTTCFWNVGQGYGQDQTITAGAYDGVLPVANGGSGVSTLTGIVKANGTSVFTAAAAADFPTLNQNTTGTAANVTGTVAVANGGTGATTLTGMLKGNGTSAISAAVAGTDYVAPAALSNYLPLSGGTLSGNLTGTTITAPIFASTPQTLTAGSTITWTASNGLNASVTLNSNSTLAFSATPPVGVYGTLVVIQPASGGPYTLALPTALTNKVLGSSTGTITLSSTANAKDLLTFYYDGSTCYWNVGQGYGENQVVTAGAYSGTLPVANGGTGASTKAAGFDALSPMTTAGDIIYGGTTGTGTRLAKGSDGQVLTLASGIPSWANAPSGGATTLGAISGTSNVNGGTISSGTLNLTAADASNGGVLTNGTQTIGGAKTFNGNVSGNTAGSSTISGFSANMNVQTGTTYQLTAADNGKIITLNNASAITLTVPTLFAGFNCMIVQLGDGLVTLTAGSGVSISNRSSFTKTAGKNAIVTLIGLSGTSFISAGDMQ